jgi:hypothetical protein
MPTTSKKPMEIGKGHRKTFVFICSTITPELLEDISSMSNGCYSLSGLQSITGTAAMMSPFRLPNMISVTLKSTYSDLATQCTPSGHMSSLSVLPMAQHPTTITSTLWRCNSRHDVAPSA